MKKYILLFLNVFLICSLFSTNVEAISTDKASLPFEITSIKIENDEMKIKGWGMITETHHFNSKKTHQYELILTSSDDKLIYYSTPLYLSQTETMKVFDLRNCHANEYYKNGNICNYNYDYVGFSFSVPLNDLKIGSTYEASLKVISNILGISKTTYVFYPTLNPIKKIKENIEYKASSNLYETSLKVIAQSVFERKSPGKNAPIRQSDKLCSFTYGYNRYFGANTTYNHIYDRVVSENTTHYKVSTQKDSSCVNGRNVVKEGSDYYSWIAGNWVDFSGETLKISVTDINTPPEITIHQHPTILQKESNSFNFIDYVTASDLEDGNLTENIKMTNDVDLSELGQHELHLEVQDKYGARDTDILIVTVIKGNIPPVIYAEDVTIYQYDKFNYLENVQAIDEEDGNISNLIQYEGNVDTSKLGDYNIVYKVNDSDGEQTTKEITVHVIRNPKEKIRFISSNVSKLFYKQAIPINWIEKIDFLREQLNSPKVITTHTIQK